MSDLLAELVDDDRTQEELLSAAVHEAGHVVAALELGIGVTGLSLRNVETHGGSVGMERGGCYPTAA